MTWRGIDWQRSYGKTGGFQIFLAKGFVIFLWVGCQQSQPPENKMGNRDKNFAPITKESVRSVSQEDDAINSETISGEPIPPGDSSEQKFGTTASVSSNAPNAPSSPVSTPPLQKTEPPVIQPLPGPLPTHMLTVDCTGGLNLSFAFGGRVQPYKMSGGFINGQPTELQTTYCPKIKTELDQKRFPTGKTLAQPQGGAGFSGTCTAGVLTFKYVSGDPANGTGIANSSGVDIESPEVCLEIRNIINGMMLSMPAPL